MKMISGLSVATVLGMALAMGQEQPQPTAPPAEPAAPATTPAQPPTATPVATSPAPAEAELKTETGKTNKAATAKSSRRTASSAPAPAGPPVTVGPAEAKQNNINVRGKASLRSEVLGRLKRGDRVEVLEIVEQKPKPDEPDKWARIVLPATTPVWVHSDFVDTTTKTVKPRRLNLRSGPSENHSVIGRLERGAAIKEIERRDDWLRIEPPPGAYGFIAAHLLAPAVAPPVEIATKTERPPPAPVTETPVAPPVTPPPATDVAATTPPTAPAEAPAGNPQVDEEIKRVVSREGIVKRSVSIQAPTWFVLESAETGKAINYLFTPSPGIVLRDYFGQRVIVTGEEGLDERWPNTPVIQVESIEVVP